MDKKQLGSPFLSESDLSTQRSLEFENSEELTPNLSLSEQRSETSDLFLPPVSHEPDKKFICDFEGCRKRFSQNSQVLKHARTHTGDKPFSCSKCSSRFSQRSNLVRHQKTHTGEKPFRCPHEGCNKAFPNNSNLNQHSQIHVPKDQRIMHQCPFCTKEYPYKSSVEKHMKRDHKILAEIESSPEIVFELPKIEIELAYGNTKKIIKIEIPGDFHNLVDVSQANIAQSHQPELRVQEILNDSDFMEKMKEIVLEMSEGATCSIKAFETIYNELCCKIDSTIFNRFCSEIDPIPIEQDAKSCCRARSNLELSEDFLIPYENKLNWPEIFDPLRICDLLAEY